MSFVSARFFAPWLLLLATGVGTCLGEVPALGFGAATRGGEGGRVLWVTRLDDDVRKPAKGSLRWALRQKGPREVRFRVGGTVHLKDRIEVRESHVTVDGSDAPGGITLRGGSLEFHGVQEVILRHLRIRLGDEMVLRKNQSRKRNRPSDSRGLDCVTLQDCRQVLIDRCSLSWSCDELIGITRCRNVTVQWCILAEPLGRPELHPYGDDHAFGVNASASTLSIHHCLFARMIMRGPQFECNDVKAKERLTVQMEAVNNVVFDYQRSGSRFISGVENGEGATKGKRFEFQFLGNTYVPGARGAVPVERVARHGVTPGLRVGMVGNEALPGRQRLLPGLRLPGLPSKSDGEETAEPWRLGAARAVPLPEGTVAKVIFEAPMPVTPEPAAVAFRRVLDLAGAGPERDAVDRRVVRDVETGSFRLPLRSQNEVGGWP